MEYGVYVRCEYRHVVQPSRYYYGPYPTKEDAEKDFQVARQKLVEQWEIDDEWDITADDSENFDANKWGRDYVYAGVMDYDEMMKLQEDVEKFEVGE